MLKSFFVPHFGTIFLEEQQIAPIKIGYFYTVSPNTL